MNYKPNALKATTLKLLLSSVFVSILLSLILESRSFFLGYIVSGCLIFVFTDWGLKRPNVKLVVALVLFISIITVVLFKTDSSLGRLLIYKITFRIFQDHWLYGIGLGKFKTIYMNYQAAYFKCGNYTEKEFLLADITTYAFNDYWQFIVEFGIRGMIAVIVVILIVWHILFKALKKNERKWLLLFAIIQLTAIVIAASLMHEFDRYMIQCLVIILMLIIIGHAYSAKKFLYFVGIAACLLCTWINWGSYLENFESYNTLDSTNDLYQAGYIEKALKNYQNIFNDLKYDPEYLIKYSEALVTHHDYKKAEYILMLLLQKRNDNIINDNLASVYYFNNEWKMAERNYLLSVNMVPNRFKNRYDLFTFYLNTKQLAKAILTGNEIMKLPIKIQSQSIETIRDQVSATLKTITK